MTKLIKIINEMFILVRETYNLLLRENRADRMNGLQREIDNLTGRLEHEESKRKAMEKYFGLEFVNENSYKLKK